MKGTLVNQIIEEIRKKQGEGILSKKQLMALEGAFLQDNREKGCEKCGRKENPSVDHIVPKDILMQLGVDMERDFIEDNLRMLCRLCNNFKSNKLDFSTPKTKEILIRLLEKI